MMQYCDRLSQLSTGQELWWQQRVADYQLIVPQEELKKVVAEEMEAFGKELPLRTEIEKQG
jgi:hypothetical protein